MILAGRLLYLYLTFTMAMISTSYHWYVLSLSSTSFCRRVARRTRTACHGCSIICTDNNSQKRQHSSNHRIRLSTFQDKIKLESKPKCILFSSKTTHQQKENNKSNGDRFLSKLSETLQNQIIPRISQYYPNNNNNEQKKKKLLVILLGVSGGCDSIALLHGIIRLSCNTSNSNSSTSDNYRTLSIPTKITEPSTSTIGKKKDDETISLPSTSNIPIQVHVVHFDHQQRGKDSDQDRMSVQDLCQRNNLPFHCYYWNDTVVTSTSTTTFSQDTAREWRRSTMIQLLQTLTTATTSNNAPTTMGGGVIMTAHHLNDSQETILLKLLRGVHITRVQGMDVVQMISSSSSSSPVLFVRPLIQIPKVEILHFLNRNNLTWREDSTNLENKYLRNRMRNELIPLLENLIGGPELLQKRLENLQDQSYKVHVDLDTRVQLYLKQSGTTSFAFVLPQLFHRSAGTEEGLLYEFGLVQEEALHSWVQSQMGYSTTFSYLQLQRVCSQLRQYPTHTIWSLDVGNGWTIARRRNLIHVGRPKTGGTS